MRFRKFSTGLSIACATLLAGCSQMPNQSELASLDYGPYPTEYRNIIDKHLNGFLKDPESKRVEYLTLPVQRWSKPIGARLLGGYAVCATVNAKNSYGGYVGPRLAYFLIKYDTVAESHISSPSDTLATAIAKNACGG